MRQPQFATNHLARITIRLSLLCSLLTLTSGSFIQAQDMLQSSESSSVPFTSVALSPLSAKLPVPIQTPGLPKQTFSQPWPPSKTPATPGTLSTPEPAATQPDSEQPATAELPLAVGDTIDVQDSVMGVLVKNGAILSDGSIGLPLVGRVNLAGTGILQARQRLNAQYRKYFAEPHISVRLVRRHPIRIYLTGAITNPGVYISGKDMRPDSLKVQASLGQFSQTARFYRLYLGDAIIMAGGLNYNANVGDVLIHRHFPQPDTLHVNLLDLFEDGNTLQDIALQDEDVIEIPALAEHSLILDNEHQQFKRSNLNNGEFKVSIIGAINKPGGYPVHQGDTVLTAIAKAGGFSPAANTGKVFVLHATDQGQLVHREINLQDKKLAGKRPIKEWAALLPNDIVFVDESTARKAISYGKDLFLDRIAVAAMFPFFSKLFLNH